MVHIQGLSQQEVSLRRQRGQGNNTNITPSRSYAQIIIKNVFTFVNIVLFSIGIILVLLGSPSDAITTAGLVTINAVIGVLQETRAKRKLDQIAILNRPQVTVIRDSKEENIHPDQLVLGDVVVIAAGDQILCDGQIVGDSIIEVDESLLTGESDYISKQNGDPIYSGSFCVTGKTLAEITKVGAENLASKITAKARKFDIMLTPLQRQVNAIVRIVGVSCILLGVFLFINAVQNEMPILERVQMAAVVMGTIPAGLIFLVTLSYAMGALRITNKGILVQQSNAIESMSNTTILCMDKTGTITTNQIKLQETYPYKNSVEDFSRLLGTVVASMTNHNRTSEAIHEQLQGRALPNIQEVPFASSRKWSGLKFDSNEDNLRGIYVLGAPEIIAPQLAQQAPELAEKFTEWSDQGLRVVLFAHNQDGGSLLTSEEKPQLPDNLIPLGLICLSDELRTNVQETLRKFREIGIKLKIISGDNPGTVGALASQAGFDISGGIVSGSELSKMDEAAFAETALKAAVFGRITPDQKEHLIESLQAQKAYVAMIGDGVNDVLALKKAHIGIAMKSGSTAARNVADLVLLEDSFAALPDVFEEGQRIVSGILDTMRLLLTRTTYVLMLIFLTTLLGVTFPFLPTQDSLNSFLTAGLPPILLAVWAHSQKTPDNLMKPVRQFIFPAAITIAMISLSIYLYFLDTTTVEYARTAILVTVILCGSMLIIFINPPVQFLALTDPVTEDKRLPALSPAIMIFFLGIMLFSPARVFFDLQPLKTTHSLLILLIVFIWSIILWVSFKFHLYTRLLKRP